MKHEYYEGAKAAEAFERLGRALFQAPKTVLSQRPKKKAAKKAVRHKPSGKDKA
jgi:hypothetical protein